MTKTLYAKLSASLLAITIVLTLLLVTISSQVSDRYSQEVTQRLNQNIAMYITDQQQLIVSGVVNREAVNELGSRMMTINPTVEVYVTDAAGKILAHALPPDIAIAPVIDLTPLKRFLAGDHPFPLLGTDPRNPGSKKTFSVSPIVEGTVTVGYLYAVLGGERYASLQRMVEESYILSVGALSIIASLAVALIAGILIFFLLTRRLTLLRGYVDDFRNEDPAQTVSFAAPNVIRDEIDELTSAFHEMATENRQQFQALQNLDATRRELITNVSHDLRTPLASMQGYLETLLIKGASLSIQDRDTYLRTAHKHSRRLNDLIGELFELSKLDSGAVSLNTEVFSLMELVHDSVQDFQLQAEQKGITLSVETCHETGFVKADIALIQRVLQNLLDNALRHTPKGQSVTVRVDDMAHCARIEVADTGRGIARHDIPHIFERHYYTRSQESAEKLGSGLGLAIVKRILDLHQASIQVSSELERGTRFTFELPLQPV